MNRRRFLQGTAGLAGAAALGLRPAGLPAAVEKPASAVRLTIIHTNDVHSHLEPKNSGDYAGLGGAAARAALIRKIRRENDHVLLVDAGDFLQGTPYFNLFKGEAEAVAMNETGYLASAIGNHEFDPGIERLAEVARKHMDFPFLCCNYDFRNTPMKGLTRESMIVEKAGLRIGLLGLGIKLDGLVYPGYFGDTRYLDPIIEGRRVARELRNEKGCDFVICLSHINILSSHEQRSDNAEPGDRDVIREVPEIDVIVGGHNHYLLPTPDVLNRRGSVGYVHQAGWAGTHLGLLQFDVYAKDQKELAAGGTAAVHTA